MAATRTLDTIDLPGRHGDMLDLEVTDAYAGFHSLTVYTVSYLENDGREYQSCNSEYFMSEQKARDAFKVRAESPDPLQPTGLDDTASLVQHAFQRYFGENTFRPEPVPTDWDALMAHVVSRAFGSKGHFYDGSGISADVMNNDRKDFCHAVPTWKLREMLVTITTLLQLVRQLEGVRDQRRAA